MSKKGMEYELFVKSVYERLNRASGLTDVRIQYDVKLVGAAGVEHQIDVFWTFKLGEVDYKVAVECKEYNTHVGKEKIEAFHAILHDIGNIHGVFASKMGFQRGAIKYAQKYGIQLMEIRKPIEKDWEGRIKDIYIDVFAKSIGDVKSQIIVDKEKTKEMKCIFQEGAKIQSATDQVKIEFGEMLIDNKIVATNNSRTMHELINQLPVGEPKKDNIFVLCFKNGIIHTEKTALPIQGIVFKYDTYESKERIEIYGDDSIMAIVKNITDGSEKSVDKYGMVKTRER